MNLKKRQTLIDARLAQRKTQQELADEIGITRSFLANLENGKYAPSLRTAFAISRAVGKKVEELFPDETGLLHDRGAKELLLDKLDK